MKFPALIPILALVLAGCSKPENPTLASPPEKKGHDTPSSPKKTGPAVSYPGTWTVADDQGQVFDIIVFPNGQAASNWTKGPAGAQGERGFWRLEGDRLIILFQDGWMDVISGSDAGFQHRRFEPGSSLDGPPKSESAAKRSEGNGFAGVWCLNKEPDGNYQYVALQSSGRAMSTIGGGTEGTWEQTKDGALCKWPDGWNDLIFASGDGFQKRSWVGAIEQNTTPPDISPAVRVGDAKFSITP